MIGLYSFSQVEDVAPGRDATLNFIFSSGLPLTGTFMFVLLKRYRFFHNYLIYNIASLIVLLFWTCGPTFSLLYWHDSQATFLAKMHNKTYSPLNISFSEKDNSAYNWRGIYDGINQTMVNSFFFSFVLFYLILHFNYLI